MEELINLYKKKYREVERKYQNYCQLSKELPQKMTGDLTIRQIINNDVIKASYNHRLFFERPESPSEFRMKVHDLLGSTNRRGFQEFCDRIGEKYIEDDPVNILRCCNTDLQQVAENYYRCNVCFNTVENYDNISTFKVQTMEKSNKYKRFDYFIELVKKIQREYNFEIPGEDMTILIQFFREVEGSWYKVYPMKSFISYPFLFRKGLELLGNYDFILKIWKIKNSDGNIKKNDQKWKKICEILNYEYIPSGTDLSNTS